MKRHPPATLSRDEWREHRRRRFRRHGRRTYIRSVYFLPSLATLGNATCGFGAMYIASLGQYTGSDRWTSYFSENPFTIAAYLIFLAMVFDALDGRLARWTRHTTDFGGQLDSLADVVSFGAAPAFIALVLFRTEVDTHLHIILSRLIWAVGALYFCCAAVRLARFNVSNEHGEQHHFSFLGLPSPGAGGTVAALILMQQELAQEAVPRTGWLGNLLENLSTICLWLIPAVVLMTGLLMVSNIRYPHLVNRYMRGKRSFARLITIVALVLLIVVAHKYVLAIGTLAYALYGPLSVAWLRLKPKILPTAPSKSSHLPPTALPDKTAST